GHSLIAVLIAALWAKDFYKEQAGSDDDAAIGDVEVGPVVVDDVDFEKVDDVGEAKAVIKIANGSAEYESECDAGEREGAACAPEHGENDDDRDDRKADKAIADDDGR